MRLLLLPLAALALLPLQLNAITLHVYPGESIQDHIDLASLTHALVSALYKNDLWTLEDLRQKDRRLNRIAVKTVGSHVWDIAKNEES